ncbi:MAG: hypothetical protein L0H79_13980 [Intrasporangium sp.]|uniref:hypothetical protein n=1 Tax=Intrasporangium sp. TaxID=1925024 RepID=UPI002646FE03|nr:hypothetical protein [Intrasporangium sp.]MDN5796849.1 hypothetical protein [Intrasporangium sp.]
MPERNWVELGAKVAAAGVQALIPGSAVVVGLADAALAKEKAQLEDWRRDRKRQKEYAAAVVTWARQQGPSYGQADIELGMKAAADVLSQRGASLDEIAAWGLVPETVAREVLDRDPVPQQGLSPQGRAVCAMATHIFYQRLITQPPPGLDLSIHREILAVGHTLLGAVGRVEQSVDELSDRLASAGHEVRPLDSASLAGYLNAVLGELDREP